MALLSPREELLLIRKTMGGFSLENEPKEFLNTGSKRLNSLYGAFDTGPFYGTIAEVSGEESSGKSTIAMDTMDRATDRGAYGIWVDAENSWKERWANQWRLYADIDPPKGKEHKAIALIQPYTYLDIKKKNVSKEELKKLLKTKEVLITPAERYMDEAEKLIKRRHRLAPEQPIFLVVDSVTALLTQREDEGGIQEQNMNTKLALASFLSRILRRWTGLFQTHNVMGVFINQIRTNPGAMFGNPDITPGGKALKFYAHTRIVTGRRKGGKIYNSDKVQIGIQGVARNLKNKAGGLEARKIGYKLYFSGTSKYMDEKDIKKS